ncbi:hypothetical protein P8X24_05105 [Pyrococcus kukulkanii]|uniref:hypothetical protein n=1 Tax=Pyrococcus kukulkanii TaxID=1609559 RepID=UPI0035665076
MQIKYRKQKRHEFKFTWEGKLKDVNMSSVELQHKALEWRVNISDFDTNVFLEILLKQRKAEIAKQFLKEHSGELTITDFTLHSIGIILSRLGQPNTFLEFLQDILPNVIVESPCG